MRFNFVDERFHSENYTIKQNPQLVLKCVTGWQLLLKVGFPTLMVGQWKGWDSHRNSRDDKKSAKRICHPAVDPLLNCALPYNFEHCT